MDSQFLRGRKPNYSANRQQWRRPLKIAEKWTAAREASRNVS